MNKVQLMEQVASRSGVGYTECAKVVDTLEEVLDDELESSAGVGNGLMAVSAFLGRFLLGKHAYRNETR